MINRLPARPATSAASEFRPASLRSARTTPRTDQPAPKGFVDRADAPDDLRRYLDQANQWPRLEGADELRLGRLVKAGKLADGTLTDAGQAAFDHLVNCNLRLCHFAAQQTHAPRGELMDLISAGHVALLAAARDFDADYGHRFSTYAYWGIRSAVFRELNFLRRTVRLPRNLHEQMAKLRKAEAELRQEKGREPSDAELAAVLACSSEKLAELRCFGQHGQSLDAPVGEDGDLTFGATLADAEAVPPPVATERADHAAALREALAQLTPRELAVIRRRHGLDGEEETLDAIGRDEGVSRERIRQIEAGALRKLRLGIRA